MTDSLGCTFFDSVFVPLLNNSPISEAGQDTAICASQLQLYATPAGIGQIGEWLVGSGSATFSSQTNPTALASGLSPGLNELIWVVFEGICSTADTVEVWVSSAAFVEAGQDTSICQGALDLNASSPGGGTGTWSSVGGNVNFSNPNSPSTTVIGLTPGVYDLIWTVSDPNCTDADTMRLEVNLPPVANFSYVPGGFTVNFTDNSQWATSWFWDFGDNNTSNQQNPTHNYLNVGSYVVCLVATGVCGTDTTCMTVDLFPVGAAAPSGPEIGIYPNPASAYVRLSGREVPEGAVKGTLVDVQGRKVREWETVVVQGNLEVEVSVADLPAGLYFVHLSGDGWTWQHRQLIAR
ncbi:MAG: PKD domain-containing protein [Bacteroidota bacterium]